MDRLLSQGTHLLCLVVTLVSGFEEVKVEIGNTLNLFSTELEAHEKDFNSWLKLRDFQLDVLVDNGVIPSRSMYIKQREILEYQMNTLEMLIKDLRKFKNNLMIRVRTSLIRYQLFLALSLMKARNPCLRMLL